MRKYWITAADHESRVILNKIVDAPSYALAMAHAKDQVPAEHHGSICITAPDGGRIPLIEEDTAVQVQPADRSKFTAVRKDLFHSHIRHLEIVHNAGCTTQHQRAEDETHWLIAGHLVGISDGPLGTNSYYFLAI